MGGFGFGTLLLGGFKFDWGFEFVFDCPDKVYVFYDGVVVPP